MFIFISGGFFHPSVIWSVSSVWRPGSSWRATCLSALSLRWSWRTQSRRAPPRASSTVRCRWGGAARSRCGFPAALLLTTPTFAGLWNFLHHLPGEDHGPLRHPAGKHIPLRLPPGGHDSDRWTKQNTPKRVYLVLVSPCLPSQHQAEIKPEFISNI